MAEDDFIVDPYKVVGKVDYQKLIKKFGTEPITPDLLKRIKKHTGKLHFMLRRNLFFTHRDMNWILDEYEKGNKFYLYTGRGPSNHTHIGHLVPWIFTKWLQDKFDVEFIFQMTDDEKFLFKDSLTLQQTKEYAYDNALDVIALGFDPKKTQIIIDTENAKTLYNIALPIAKKITYSTVKASFGFDHSANIGSVFYTAIQAAPSILKSVQQGRNIPCLIPHGVDQDPHFRVCRDVIQKLGYYKPASIQNKFIPGLRGPEGKMSASDPNSTVFVTDTPKQIKKKINKHAFSGGQPDIETHRKLGGNPDIDVSFQWLKILFEPVDKKLNEIEQAYRSGDLLTGELKAILIEKVTKFLTNHQKEREKAKDKLEDFIVRD